MFLLKDTTQWRRWGSNPRPFGLESSTLPLSHCAPWGCYVRGDINSMGCYVRGDKNSMGCFVRGDKNSMGCFVRGVKKWHGMFCPGMFCPAPGAPIWILKSMFFGRIWCYVFKRNDVVMFDDCVLALSLVDEWNNLEPRFLRKLVQCMPQGVRELHQRKGGYTHYWRRFLKRPWAWWHWLLMSN